MRFWQSIRSKWLISHIVVLAVLTGSMLFSWNSAYSLLSEEIDRNQSMRLQELRQAVDSSLHEFSATTNLLIFDSHFRAFCATVNPLMEKQQYTIVGIQSLLSSLTQKLEYIKSITTFFAASDYVISPTDSYKSSLLQSKYLDRPVDERALQMIVANAQMQHLQLMRTEQGDLLLYRKVRMTGIRESAYVVAELDSSALLAEMGVGHSETPVAVLLSIDGETVLTSDAALSNAYGESPQDWTTLSTPSDVASLSYVFLRPMSMVSQRLSHMRSIMAWVMAFALGVSIVVIRIMTTHQYKPVRELIARLPGGNETSGSEYAAIHHALDHMQTELESQSRLLTRTQLADALRGNVSLPGAPQDVCCLLAKLHAPQDTNLSFVHILLEELLRYRLSGFGTCQFVAINAAYACVFPCADSPQTREWLEEEVAKVRSETVKRYHMPLSCVAVFANTQALAPAYQQAAEWLTLHHFYARDTLFCTRPTAIQEPVPHIVDEQTAGKLQQALLQGDGALARALLQVLLSRIAGQCESLHALRSGLYALSALLIRMEKAVEQAFPTLPLPEALSVLAACYRCATFQALEAQCRQFVHTLADAVSTARAQAPDALFLRVVEYINTHYEDPDLNISAISEALSFSATHIARIFKRNSGQGIPDTIHYTRIAHAKTLLREERARIYSVAARVGYTDTSTFIRQFKRLEGMTPGEFVEQR